MFFFDPLNQYFRETSYNIVPQPVKSATASRRRLDIQLLLAELLSTEATPPHQTGVKVLFGVDGDKWDHFAGRLIKFGSSPPGPAQLLLSACVCTHPGAPADKHLAILVVAGTPQRSPSLELRQASCHAPFYPDSHRVCTGGL